MSKRSRNIEGEPLAWGKPLTRRCTVCEELLWGTTKRKYCSQDCNIIARLFGFSTGFPQVLAPPNQTHSTDTKINNISHSSSTINPNINTKGNDNDHS